MDFLKRLGYFLFGLSIGLVLLTVFLKNKYKESDVFFCYLPNCRTLKNIRSKPLYYSEVITKMLKNKEIDSVDINNFLYNGDVDFGKSDTKSVPCKTYFIEGEFRSKQAVLKVINCTKKATITTLKYLSK